MGRRHRQPTIAFRPSDWERAIIDERVAVSGMPKKDFISRCCMDARITFEGNKELAETIVDAARDLKISMSEIAGQIQSGDFSLSDDNYRELKEDFLALAITLVDILDGAAYLFEAVPPPERRNWKASMRLDDLRTALERQEHREDSQNLNAEG